MSSINDRAREAAPRSAKLRWRSSGKETTLQEGPQTDHDFRRDSTIEHQQTCSRINEFASIMLTAHSPGVN